MIYKLLTLLFLVLTTTTFPYDLVDKPYKWSFPFDHGIHKNYQVEWWYFTGHLTENSQTQRTFGFELTFFRIGNKFSQDHSNWSFNNMYVTHFTITDDKNNDFFDTEWAHREMPGLSMAEEGKLSVMNGPFSVEQKKDLFIISAKKDDVHLTVTLRNSKPIVFHGENGFHQKTSQKGSASYYYSMTRLIEMGLLK